jgi:NADH-quinone oxidoreductase subunit J
VSTPQQTFIAAMILSAWGMWWLLPPGGVRKRMAGAVLAAVAVGLWASRMPGLGQWMAEGVFYVLAGVTVVAALGAVTFRNPVYCAIWFGLTLLGTAGLLLLIGAQFLAVATVAVYAGAILVTFLFVLMLAQPEGRAPYDRTSWEAMLAAVTGAMLVGILSLTISSVLAPAERPAEAVAAAAETRQPAEVLAAEQVARLGGELFGRHLLAVEVAGTLLLAALVGAAVIAAQSTTDNEA